MDTENLASHDGGDREGVEHVDECFPSFDVGSTFTFVVEAVDYKMRDDTEYVSMRCVFG